jgi:hypothetical protein
MENECQNLSFLRFKLQFEEVHDELRRIDKE